MKAVLTTTNFQAGQRWQRTELESGPMGFGRQVTVYPELRGQRFQGFGGAFTQAAASCWQRLPEDRRQAFLDCYFGPDGLGYTLGRTHIGSCDFALGNYACLAPRKVIAIPTDLWYIHPKLPLPRQETLSYI